MPNCNIKIDLGPAMRGRSPDSNQCGGMSEGEGFPCLKMGELYALVMLVSNSKEKFLPYSWLKKKKKKKGFRPYVINNAELSY